jgi:hypothetical protein
MVVAPARDALLPQPLQVDLANLLENLAHTVEIADLPVDLRDLGGMEANLARLAARIVDVEDPLEVTFAVGTGGAGNRSRMEGATFEDRTTQEGIERRERVEELADAGKR